MSDQQLYAVIGLGNPGTEHEYTRHNAGFWFADRVAERHRGNFRIESKFFGALARLRIGDADVLLLKPGTFMNRSGQAVSALAQFYKLPPENLLIAHDELDLPAGDLRLKLGGGHGGHNGLRDIHKPIGEGYRRLRIGIGHPGDKNLVLNYVLGRPSKTDAEIIDAGLDRALNAVETWLTKGWDKAVQQLHTPTGSA